MDEGGDQGEDQDEGEGEGDGFSGETDSQRIQLNQPRARYHNPYLQYAQRVL